MTKRLTWICIATLAAYLVFIGGVWNGIYLPAPRLASVLLAGLVLAIWAFLFWRGPELRPRSSLYLAIGACLGSLLISTVFSRFPGISVEYLAYAVVLASLYLLLVQLLRDEFFRSRFVLLSSAFFATIVVAFLALVVSDWIQWWTALGRLSVPPLRPDYESLTFGNPSAVLTVVALLAVPVVATVDWTTRRGVLTVGLVLAAVGVVALLSGSRAGWLALAITAVVAVGLLTINRAGRTAIVGALNERVRNRGGRLGLGVAAIAFIAIVIALTPAIFRRVGGGGETLRLTYAQVALRMFLDSPVVGTGPGTWVVERRSFTEPGEVDDYIPHAHDMYVQTLAEQGLVGAIAGGVLVIALARLLLRAIRSPDESRRRWGWATLLGLVYFGAHQILDFYANFPAVLFIAALPIAYIDATAEEDRERPSRILRKRAGRPALAVATAVVAMSVAGLALQELPALQAEDAVSHANAGDWIGAAPKAIAAASEDPRISPYLFTAGLAADRLGDHTTAKDYFRTVADRDDLPEAWLNLAAEQFETGDLDGVEPSIRAALRLGVQRPAIDVAAGDLALRAGYRELGIDALTAVAIGAPSFLADPWWRDDPRARDVSQDVATRASAQAPWVAWEIALMLGNVVAARQAAQASGADQSTIEFIDAWGGDEQAADRLISGCRSNPFESAALALCARIADRHDEPDLAARFRKLADLQASGSGRFGAELRVAQGGGAGSADTTLALFWGPFTYRRFTPWDMLVPSLLHLVGP